MRTFLPLLMNTAVRSSSCLQTGPTMERKSLLADRFPKGLTLVEWVLGLLLTKK